MGVKIMLDPGHGMQTAGKRTFKFDDGTFMHEREFNSAVANALQRKLQCCGFEVYQTVEDDSDMPITTRYKKANDLGVAYFVSIHANASGATTGWDSANGTETLYCASVDKNSNTYKWAAILQNYLVHDGTFLRDRGLVPRSDLGVLNGTKMPAALVECAFMTNKAEAELLRNSVFRTNCATGLARGICDIFGYEYIEEVNAMGTPIMNKRVANAAKMETWAKSKGATAEFLSLIPIYQSVCDYTGVDPIGAFVQAGRETGYGRFGGVINASFCNPCGMKTTKGGASNDPAAHHKFPNWTMGVQAHVDHLALYAGAPGYPKTVTHDPRHFASICGKASTFEGLTGAWAEDPKYGTEIVAEMTKLLNIVTTTRTADTIMNEIISHSKALDKLYEELNKFI